MKLNSNTVLNFLWLFFSSIAIKGIGVLRESIVAAKIGNSPEFATFNIFRSVVDFVLAFAISVPIIESILVPKLASLYSENKDLSFRSLWKQTVKYGYQIFIITFTILLAVTFFKSDNYKPDTDILIWVILFSIYLSISLSNSVTYSLLKVVGDFRMYSYMSFFTAIGTLVLIYLFIDLLGLKIIVIAPVFLIIISTYIIKKILSANFIKTGVQTGNTLLNVKDFNLNKMIAVNHPIFIGFTGRLIIGLGNTAFINLYQYSFIIVSSFLLVVVSNISSIILYRHSTDSNISQLKVISVTFFITLGANIVLYLFGKEIIAILYQRGKFTAQDTIDTYNFLKIFLVPYTFFSLTQVMIQSYMKDSKNNTLFFKYLTHIIIATVCLGLIIGFFKHNYQLAVEVLLYTSSLSIFTFLIFKQKNLFI